MTILVDSLSEALQWVRASLEVDKIRARGMVKTPKPAQTLFVAMAVLGTIQQSPKPSANLRLEALHVRHFLLPVVLVGG